MVHNLFVPVFAHGFYIKFSAIFEHRVVFQLFFKHAKQPLRRFLSSKPRERQRGVIPAHAFALQRVQQRRNHRIRILRHGAEAAVLRIVERREGFLHFKPVACLERPFRQHGQRPKRRLHRFQIHIRQRFRMLLYRVGDRRAHRVARV